MKHLPLGLFVAYLLFICSKSVLHPITFQEALVLGVLSLLMVVPKVLSHLHRKDLRKFRILDKELDLKKPILEDSEIAALKKENDIAALKREISKTIETKGGMRF